MEKQSMKKSTTSWWGRNIPFLFEYYNISGIQSPKKRGFSTKDKCPSPSRESYSSSLSVYIPMQHELIYATM